MTLALSLTLAAAADTPVSVITAFLREYWSPSVALGNDTFYQWQMRTQPDASLLVWDDQNQLAGFLGVTPHALVTPSQETLPAAVTTTLILRPDCRGGPMASQLFQHLQARYAALFGMNLNPTSQSLQRRLGYRIVQAVERMVRVFNHQPFVQDLSAAGKNLLSLHRRIAAPTQVVPFTESPDVEALLDHYQFPLPAYHLCRNWAWYQWRIAHHPFYQYQTFHLYPDQPSQSALVIIRQEAHAHFTVAHVVDCLPLGGQFNPHGIPPFLEQLGRSRQWDLLDMTCTLSWLTAPLWQAGWLSTVNDTDLWLPHLFNPLTLRTPPTGNVAIWGHLPGLLDISQLYLAKSDADWDRPTFG